MRWRLRHARAVEPSSLSPFELAAIRFNASEAGRTVAGLVRTLGAPSVSVGASPGRPEEVRVTVAWELTWYQWGVDVGADPDPVVELGQGSEIDQLDPPPASGTLPRPTAAGSSSSLRAGAAPPPVPRPDPEAMAKLTVNVDGGARGNPGPAAIGAIVRDGDGEVLEERGERIGRATNNVAEYRALLLGIELAGALGAAELELIGDSELIVRQVEGRYKVKDATMKELHAEVKRGAASLSTTGRSATSAASTMPTPIVSSTGRWTAEEPHVEEVRFPPIRELCLTG